MRAVLAAAQSNLAVPALAAAWAARETVAAPEIIEEHEVRCIRNACADALGGTPIGWKVGLTSAAAQQRFGIDHGLPGGVEPAVPVAFE